jgi:hypothetical protein
MPANARSGPVLKTIRAADHAPASGAGKDAASTWASHRVQVFALRMMDHGLCVSPALMQRDRRYALNQLNYAMAMEDAVLSDLAQQLASQFAHSETLPATLHFARKTA